MKCLRGVQIVSKKCPSLKCDTIKRCPMHVVSVSNECRYPTLTRRRGTKFERGVYASELKAVQDQVLNLTVSTAENSYGFQVVYSKKIFTFWQLHLLPKQRTGVSLLFLNFYGTVWCTIHSSMSSFPSGSSKNITIYCKWLMQTYAVNSIGNQLKQIIKLTIV